MKLSLEDTSLFMFFGVFGGMAIQLPIGKLSDYFDRRLVMLFVGGFLFLVINLLDASKITLVER